jgi:hypothetical protein
MKKKESACTSMVKRFLFLFSELIVHLGKRAQKVRKKVFVDICRRKNLINFA